MAPKTPEEIPLLMESCPRDAADRHVLDYIHRCRQGTDSEYDGQVSCLLVGKTAADLSRTSKDTFADNRCGANNTIENNGHPSADIFFGYMRKNLSSPAGHIEADIRFIKIAADPYLGVLDHIAGHQDFVFKEEGDERFFFGLFVDLFFKVK